MAWSGDPQPVKFARANHTYQAPPGADGGFGTLPCYRDGGKVVSCWRFPIVDRLRFLFTGEIWLWVIMPNHPPIALQTTDPFSPAPAETTSPVIPAIPAKP